MARQTGDRVACYGLYDPRSSQVRYIGTTVDPLSRYSRHCAVATGDYPYDTSLLARWLRGLGTLGLRPEMIVIAEVAAEDADAEEARLIDEAWDAGEFLLNQTRDGLSGEPSGIWSLERLSKLRQTWRDHQTWCGNDCHEDCHCVRLFGFRPRKPGRKRVPIQQ